MKAMRVAGLSMTLDIVGGATHYHTLQVAPEWSSGMKVTRELGNHLFFIER
jgi:N-acetylmuramoyl-L-alanine amidase